MDYKILIADDEPEIRNLLRLYLENENYHVIEAEDGQRALDLLRAEQPALCILDIMMPVMNGYEAAKMIRTLDRDDAKTVPIIAMTANAFTEDRLKSKESGMNEHIAKPIDAKLLVKVISEFVENKEEDS